MLVEKYFAWRYIGHISTACDSERALLHYKCESISECSQSIDAAKSNNRISILLLPFFFPYVFSRLSHRLKIVVCVCTYICVGKITGGKKTNSGELSQTVCFVSTASLKPSFFGVLQRRTFCMLSGLLYLSCSVNISCGEYNKKKT